MSTANKLIATVQTVREKAHKGFTPQDIANVRTMTDKLLGMPEALMGVISIGKVCPQGVDIEQLAAACKQHNPLLLDELMDYPGVNALHLQEAIVESLNVKQGVDRVQLWYPANDQLPAPLQRALGTRIYNRVISEIVDGPVHKRELSGETGVLLDKAVGWIGNRLQSDQAVFSLLRASHYVLRGMARSMELHHQLDDSFVEKVFNAAWEHYNLSRSESALVNAVALTVSNRDLYPQALDFLAMHQPAAFSLLQPVWNEDAKDITKFINRIKQDAGMDKTVIARGAGSEELAF